MGLIKRLRRITSARIEAFLDSVEKPEAVLPRLVEELAEKVAEAAAAEAKALTVVKAAQRRLDETVGRAARLERGAKLAVAAGEIDTARQAIAAQLDAEAQAESGRAQLAAAECAYADATAVRGQLQAELEDLKTRKDEILARLREVRRRTGRGGRAAPAAAGEGSLLEEVARMEAKVDAAEAELEIQDELSGAPASVAKLERQVDALQHDAEIDRRLARLKQDLGKE